MKDLAKKFNTSMNTFPDASEDEADLLHTFSFICMLSYDVYIKKTLIEKMIDQMASKNPETKPSKITGCMLPAQITCYVLPYLTEKPLFSMEQQAAHFAECPVVTN